MVSFGRFAETRLDRRVKCVSDIRCRQNDPDGYIKKYHYGVLLNTLRWSHWSSGKIEAFEDLLEPLVDRQKEQRKNNYRAVGEAYIAFWKERGADYFSPPRVDMEIHDLTVRVNPEIGMTVGPDSQALKLWCNGTLPTRTMRGVLTYFLERAASENEHWPDHAGIWAVRDKQILLPVRIPEADSSIRSLATAFLEIWSELEAREERARDEGQDVD